MMNLFTLFILFSILFPLKSYCIDQEKISDLKKELDVQIIIDQSASDTEQNFQYEAPSNQELLKKYLNLLKIEAAKYPKEFFTKVKISTIVLVENLTVNNKREAVFADPVGNKLYLAIDGYGNKDIPYQAYLFHHQLYHLMEIELNKNLNFNLKEWTAMNPKDFQYSKNGMTGNFETELAYRKPTNPKPGFINLYSTASEQEDRAELFAMLMSGYTYYILKEKSKNDAILKKKVEKLIAMVDSYILSKADAQSYWPRIVTKKSSSRRIIERADIKNLNSDWAAKDLEAITEKFTASIKQNKNITGKYKKVLFTIANEMANDTDEHINTRIILETIRAKLINQAGLKFIDDQAIMEIMKKHQMQKSDLYDPKKAAKVSQLSEARIILRGRIANIRVQNQKTSVNTYYITLNLTDLQTGRIIWADEFEITKKAEKARFR